MTFETDAVPSAAPIAVAAGAAAAMQMRRRLLLFVIVAVATAVVDQGVKAWIRGVLPQGAERPLLPGWVHLSHILNHGAAWGMLSGQRPLLIGVAALVVVVVSMLARDMVERGVLTGVGLGLILGGAIGNLIDRVVSGAVTDFIDLDTSIAWIRTFPVFNLADSALTIGVVLLALGVLLSGRQVVEPKTGPVIS